MPGCGCMETVSHHRPRRRAGDRLPRSVALQPAGGAVHPSSPSSEPSPSVGEVAGVPAPGLRAVLAADVLGALTSARTITDALQACCEAIVSHVGAAFARVWTL